MSQKETLDRAYGSIPKEVGYSIDFSLLPPIRGIKYYYHTIVRYFTR